MHMENRETLCKQNESETSYGTEKRPKKNKKPKVLINMKDEFVEIEDETKAEIQLESRREIPNTIQI